MKGRRLEIFSHISIQIETKFPEYVFSFAYKFQVYIHISLKAHLPNILLLNTCFI
jgi:hypothetical protein